MEGLIFGCLDLALTFSHMRRHPAEARFLTVRNFSSEWILQTRYKFPSLWDGL